MVVDVESGQVVETLSNSNTDAAHGAGSQLEHRDQRSRSLSGGLSCRRQFGAKAKEPCGNESEIRLVIGIMSGDVTTTQVLLRKELE